MYGIGSVWNTSTHSGEPVWFGPADEIQLRTRQQDVWAQSVETDMRRLGAGLKFGAGPDDLLEYYRLVGEFFALRAQGEEPSEALQRRLARLYHATQKYYG